MAVVICNRYGPFYVAWYAFDVFANKVANKKNWGKYRGTRKKAAAAGKARKKAKAEARREVKEDGKNYQTTTIVCRSNIKIKYIYIYAATSSTRSSNVAVAPIADMIAQRYNSNRAGPTSARGPNTAVAEQCC
jgi:hypothetical protein